MDVPGGDGWVCEGDLAPSFELPDTKFKPVSPIRPNTKVKHQCLGLVLPVQRGSTISECFCASHGIHKWYRRLRRSAQLIDSNIHDKVTCMLFVLILEENMRTAVVRLRSKGSAPQ